MGGSSGATAGVVNAPEGPRRGNDTSHHPRVGDVVSCLYGSYPWPGESVTVAIVAWNIRSGHGGGMEAACRALDQMGVSIAVVMETKVAAGRHTRFSSGFHVLALLEPSKWQGG